MSSPESIVRIFDRTHQQEWEEAYQSLPEVWRDIHLTYSYHQLFDLSSSGSARLFFFKEGASLYYYPFFLRDVPEDILPGNYKDIETAYGYTGPISNDPDPEFLKRAYSAFETYVKENNILSEFIRFHPLLKNHVLCREQSSTKLISLRDYVYVDLEQDEESNWSSYSAPNRNKIRKAQKSGIQIYEDPEAEHFDVFKSIYLENMRSIGASKMYFFSEQFFSGLRTLVEEQGALLLARKGDSILAAGVFLGGGKVAHYFLASATPDGKRLAAGNLLLHEGIRWAKHSGHRYLHLGGGVSAAADDALLLFKKNFSSLTEKFYIGKRIHDIAAYNKACEAWDLRFAPRSAAFAGILQRYQWKEEDLPVIA